MTLHKLTNFFVGKRLASSEEEENRVGVWEAVPMLGLDALGSSSYGPEAALVLLMPLGVVGIGYALPIILVILVLLAILYFSYRQTIAAYPNGGGSYTVAKSNLGDGAGLLAASALALDYLLNVAVGISAGVGALVSAVPVLHPHILALCLITLGIITMVNLRGVRESGVAWMLPTYLFIGGLFLVICWGVAKTVAAHGQPHPVAPPAPVNTSTAAAVSLWLLLRAFASGCTAMTGVEAVSNGITAFGEPRVKRAQKTLTAIVVVLAVLLLGIAFLARAYHIGAMDQEKPGYQSVVSQLIAAVVGRGALYYVVIASVLAVLCLSANTSFAGFPRLCRLLAEDEYLPSSFANRGRRLVFTMGILVLTVLSALVLVVFGGITDRLIPLFAIGAFFAFTMSQAGMVMHWRRLLRKNNRDDKKTDAAGGTDAPPTPGRARASLALNALGCAATGTALCVILIAKFREGAWITLLIVPALLFLFYRIKRHYRHIARQVRSERPFALGKRETPVVVVPIVGWNRVTEKALRFAYQISDEIIAVHVAAGDDDEKALRENWKRFVEEPLMAAGVRAPRLEILSSPYRRRFGPLLRYLKRVEKANPNRHIGVIIPELVEARWWWYPLHNQHAAALKAALWFGGASVARLTVMNVPWYVREPLAKD